eukprot:GHVQ01023156.1.p1 GENE.GHVQ01023156.1~~GHVQ01023156.1.p1  ORF type:complete len:347 (-),score=35.38 GHVQ01023156.1:4017-5057(-)
MTCGGPHLEVGISAYELMLEEKQCPVISTGIRSLDALLSSPAIDLNPSTNLQAEITNDRKNRKTCEAESENRSALGSSLDVHAAQTCHGGITSSDGIYEICGEPGTGKTQLALQLCICTLLASASVYDHNKTMIVFIDTRGTFFAERFLSLARHAILSHRAVYQQSVSTTTTNDATRNRNTTEQDLLEQTTILRVYDHIELLQVLHDYLLPLIANKTTPHAGLLVIDCLTNLYNHSYHNRFIQRSSDLLSLASCLNRISACLTVVVTNDVTTKLTSNHLPLLLPALGATWASVAQVKIIIERVAHYRGENRELRAARIVRNKRGALGTAFLYISEEGMRDVEDGVF